MAMRGSHPSGSHLLAIYIALFVVATITVVLRLCVRSARGQKSGADDSLIIVAWVGAPTYPLKVVRRVRSAKVAGFIAAGRRDLCHHRRG